MILRQRAVQHGPGRRSRGPAVKSRVESNLLILVTFALLAFGLVMVFSATSGSATVTSGNPTYYLMRQGISAAIGVALLAVIIYFGGWHFWGLAPYVERNDVTLWGGLLRVAVLSIKVLMMIAFFMWVRWS